MCFAILYYSLIISHKVNIIRVPFWEITNFIYNKYKFKYDIIS